ncbi:cytochrome c maturation protein CcmE [Enterovirga rhinocerotis]|uniref:Cytochrome c-type biogenesis protein CcmE n=1 Tax=Enterovirga rhinocerotis TaxID=1339210 RepID=A0A4R7C0Z1_9HYPH|nr:cytochrome c maturation protein CcmE [Enterovirga rhinocerotis]TDR90046.1 cytochrome c-type biogenesis protein CcmE [Enterovirga rhinocerotis]
MTRRSRRIAIIAVSGAVLALALGLALYGMRGTIVFFRTPTQVIQEPQVGQRIRLGGLVETGSIRRGPDQTVTFAVTDGASRVTVHYRGLLPDLFREGQGVVTEGAVEASGSFRAATVLARHDENYMPREVADALKAQGHWKDGKVPAAAAAGPADGR